MKRSRVLKSALVSLVLLVLALLIYPAANSNTQQPNGLQEAWERARAAGAYRFTADIEQTLIPRPLPGTIGQTDQHVDMRVEGEVTSPDRARLELRLEGAGLDVPPLGLVQEGTETYLLKDGVKVPVENPASLAAPSPDYLVYLAAAENVRLLDEPAPQGMTRYAYEISGPRLAATMRDRLEAQLAESGEPAPPPGVTLSPSPVLQRVSGSGELWVDADGLPRRQVLDLELPEASEAYDMRAHVIVDLRFDGQAVQQGDESAPRIAGGLDLPIAPAHLGLFLVWLVLACMLVAYWRRRRWVYGLIAVGVTCSMLATPPLQAAGVARFVERQAQAAPVETIAEALGLSTETTESAPGSAAGAQPSAPNARHPTLSAAAADPAPALQCGAGRPDEDTDGDELNDAAENCLGTDPYTADSDRDLLADTLEIDGFVFGGRTWPSDPLKPDSNGDGLPDTAEWPAPVGMAPHLDDVEDWDPDADGVPNLWDDDNDGDGVPDGLDLSPFSRTAYRSTFSLSTQGSGFDGYQYIEIQLRPENEDHLRYSTAALDWPPDSEGQIQDDRAEDQDLRLIPMLRIRANRAPAAELAQHYGLSAFKEDDGVDLYAPLLPVSDGGRIAAFFTRLAYGPDEIDDVRWQEVQLVWIVERKADAEAGVSQSAPIQIYTGETFGVTGLRITKSAGFESAILGTPGSPDDDRDLFNVLFGLSSTFLSHQEPTLSEVEMRFGNPNTDIVETWGVAATRISVDLGASAHRDEGLDDLRSRARRLLDQNVDPSSHPSLVFASQEQRGSYSLDDLGQFEPGNAFSLNLAHVELVTRRGLQLHMYEYENGRGWRPMRTAEKLGVVGQRYADLGTTLDDLEASYPELTAADLLALTDLFYVTWEIGSERVIAVDGRLIAPEGRPDLDVYDRLYWPEATALPAYLLQVGRFAEVGGGLQFANGQQWSYLNAQAQISRDLGVVVGSADLLDHLDMILTNANASDYWGSEVFGSEAFKFFYKLVMSEMALAGAVLGLSETLGSIGTGIGVVALAVDVGLIWTVFGMTDYDNPIDFAVGLATALAATVFSIALFALTFIPVVGDILVLLYLLIDLILFEAIGVDVSSEVVSFLAGLYVAVNPYTVLEDIWFFQHVDSGPLDPRIGVIEGSRYRITDRFRGLLSGDPEWLKGSYAEGWYESSAAQEDASAGRWRGSADCTLLGNKRYCENDMSVTYVFKRPARDMELAFRPRAQYMTWEKLCLLPFLIWCLGGSAILPSIVDLPEDLGGSPGEVWDWHKFTLDVLPGSLTGLWGWNEINNLDPDGDGLLGGDEAALGTDPERWDSDDDGLSDRFEFDARQDLGADPLAVDSDGDGLTDGLEYRINTRIDRADPDGDGLSDGQEVYHLNDGGTPEDESDDSWEGGWPITLPGRAQPVWILSDPRTKDADGDGLDDFAERANGTSPYAYNDAPCLTLQAEPLALSPAGTPGAYVQPGDTLTLTLRLDSVGPQPVTGTLTLCLPDLLSDFQGGEMGGDRSPPAQPAPACNGLAWSFAGEHTLQRWETVSTTLTARVDAALSASVEETALASLPYSTGGQAAALSARAPLVVDAEDPQVAVVAPPDGALLGGGSSAYVIGGSASDDSSWVTRVELVDLPLAGGVETVTAEGTGPWAYTWELPADGTYTLRARAYDQVGHASPDDTATVTVDNTAPTVTLDLSEGQFVTGQVAKVITITLSGSASDNLSGLARVQVSTDGRPWREVWAEGDAPLSAGWSTAWTLPSEVSAQGQHTVAARAFDRAGNESETLQRTIVVDVLPPTDESTNRTYLENPPHVPVGQPLTLHGVANDAGRVPPPPRPAELLGTLDSLGEATIWLELASVGDNDAGVSVTWLGDLNGDRLADLALGLPAAADGAGRVTLLYGRAGGWPVPPNGAALAQSPSSFLGLPGAGLGAALAAAGDVDGDGLSDLLIGDPASNRVFLVFGRPSAIGPDTLLDGPQTARWSEIIPPLGEAIGERLGAAGDVDGDGYDDLLIGATGAEDKAYLLLGQPRPWWDTVPLDPYAAAEIATGPAGARLSGVGDMDGDGRDEFVVVVGTTVYLFAGQGSYTAHAGASLNLTDDAIASFESTTSLPAVAALGDVDGDGLTDFAFANGDTPRLVFGDADRNWTSHDLTFWPAPSGFLAAPGDVDADGRADLLLGNADGDAYLLLGADLDQVAATLTGVAAAASVPYAAGGDLNSDGSSDLLLVPAETAAAQMGMYSLDYGQTPYVDPASLPVAVTHAPAALSGDEPALVRSQIKGAEADASQAVTHTVDDDGCPGCITTLAAAVEQAGAGDTIIVQPGVYERLEIGPGKDYLTVQGVDADAVFVDGGGGLYAAHVSGTVGVRLANLTLRNAQRAVWLENAGGYEHPEDATALDHLLIHAFSEHALYMDRASSVALSRCTLVGGGASSSRHIQVYGPPDPALEASWSTVFTGTLAATGAGGGVHPSDRGVYVLPGGGSDALYRYDPLPSAWYTITVPFAVSAVGGAAATSDGSLHFLHPDAWTGPAGGGRFGQSVSTAGDVNGDGYGDVIVGAPDRSSAYLYLGSSTGLSAEPAWSATGSGVGWDVGTAGDVNGDGYDDVLVVEYNSERAHVYLGGDSGLSPTPVATLSGENSGEEFGSSASAAGDVNGDGYDDIIVGAKAYDTYTGRAYLYLGDTDGISTTAPITLSGENPYDWFGDAVGTAGDVNGDGYDDVLVGARKAADMTGRAYLYLGGASGPAPTPIVLAGDSYFGSSVDTAGDVNGDGYADVTVAELRPARAHVYLGGESGLSTTAVATLLSGDSEQFCYSAGTAGDVNGDGYADVIVGQVPASQGAGYGQTYVYLGDTRGISNTAPTLLAGYSPDKWFGLSVGGAGDVNGDGYDDVIVGDAGYSDNAGRVYYHLGGQGGLSNTLCTAGKYLYLCPGCVSPFRHSRYSIHEDAWSERSPLPEYVDPADIAISLTRDGSDRLCALAGGSLQSLYCYDVVDDAWSLNRNQEARPPFTVSVDTATVWADGALYVLAGESSEFWRYDPGNSALWEPLQSVAVTVAAGASLAWDGGEWIYALVGGNSKQFLRYHVPTDQWQVLGDGSTLTPDDDDTPIGINAGGGLALFGQGLYAVPGGDVGALWRYSPVGVTPDKLALDRVAFVVPETAAAPTWLNPDLPAEDFALSGSGNAWVAGSGTAWSPSPSLEDSRLMAHDEARFLDADRGVYRLGADSILDAGYHIYRPDAIVAAGGGEEFTSIQAAVHSGANRVLVRPGVYPEPFYLVSGVEVIGACADKTLIELPGGSSAPALVRAEGVVRAGLSRLTLAGDGVVDGLHVEDGARFIVVARDIVRGAGAGIRVEGPEADVEVVNNTLVGNVSGLVAANCASVDVRNTILAYHGSAGLQYEPCAGTKLHSYNLYWANGVDVDDGTSDPAAGAGERFLDPLFVDVPGDDYRTVAESPAIDAGDPTDPAPPGAGSRVDIGYLEQGRAAFYADDDYCEFCANDGLTWQVDAFDTIQDALDVAADELSVLAWPDRPPRYTVGVGPGLYSEAITLPSHLRLVGAATLGGAEETVLDAGGRETAVTLDGVVQAELSGLTIMGASSAGVAVLGASNAITVSRNIIAGNPNGVALSGRATGLVAFNTLADNSGDGILCSGHGTWALVANNILADNDTGLHTRDGGRIWNDYNLLDNTSNYVDEAGTGLTRGPNELVDLDPLFETGSYRLRPTSPAVDAASPFAPVPPGGGARADMGYREVLATPLTLLLGRQGVSTAMGNSGVQEVQVGITPLADPGQRVTETLPAAWSVVDLASPGNTVSYWQTGFTPGDEGLYRLYSRATDVVGNRESDEEAWYDGAWVADGSPPDVTWLSPPGSSILTAPLELRAEVSDYPGGHFGVREIHFEVDGTPHAAQWAVEPWDPASGQPRVFRAWISAPVGIHDVIAVAEDRAGHVGQSAPVNLTVSGYAEADTTPPTLAVSSPAPGSWVTHTVVWSGTAGDGESGLASVEVSMDGGTTWRPADVSGADWSLPWITPLGQEYVSYPARVRARDRAGNATVDARVVTVDNLAPTGLYPVTFSAPQGTHLDARTPLTIAWNAPLDGSGSAFVLLAADQVSDTIPAEQAPGTGATVELGASGQWYVHLATRDQAGNQLTRHYGPWHVGTFDDPDLPFAGREQSIVIDGYLDLANDEWRDDREFLDDDERPRERQSLYVTWDGQAFYLAWQGAWWTLDGGLWAYLDLESGGTDQPLAGGRVLPFEADRAVSVDGAQGGTLWTYSGGAWRPGPLEFAHGDSGGTELRLPLDNSQVEDLRLIAFALDHDGVPWSVFPTTNPLPGPWPDAYHWVNPSVVSSPGAGQLRGTSVQMALSSPQAPQAAWGPGSALAYVVDLANGEAHEVEGLALTFHASEGLAYQAVAGATCADCTAGDAWRLDVPSLPAGAGHRITVTGQLASSLDDLRAVTSTVTLELESAALDQAALSHRVDGQPPTVTVGIAAGQLLGPGLQTIHGTASDGDGIGVAAVEVRPASSADWQTANGTRFWSIDVSVPADATTWPLEARARDLYGQIGQVTVEFIVDATPPTVTLDLPPYLAGNYAKIGGTTADRPPPGRVDGVDVQLDQDTALWQPALVVSPDATGLQNWHLIWDLPLQDGVTHTLRVRASDAAGNVSLASGWQSTVVDNVAPLVTVTHVLSEVEWADYGPGGTPDGPVISGTVSDGSGVSAVRVRLDTPTGSSYEEAAEHQGGAWSYTPILEGPGLHRLYVRATDAAGNVSVRGPFDLLAAASLSPTLRGSVGMQGRRTKPDPSWAIPLTVWLAAADGGTPACSFTTTTDQEGKFELLLEGITPGRYDISVKGNHTLRNLARDVELAAGDNDTYMGTLLEGDAETVFTFNRVGLADAFTLLRSFGRCRGHPRFIANADLDESDCVWIPDFGLLARNFGKKGDVVVRAATSLPPEPPPGEGDGALLAFQRERMTVEVNETVTLTLAIDPRGEPVNGGAVDLRFDPALIEVVDVSLSDHLPFVLEEPLVDNQEGVVRFSAGVLDQALSEPFSIATLSLRVKEDTTGTTITFTDAFSATDVSGPTGSVLTEARGITLGTFKNHVYLPAITR